ncbi:MAG: hypothetical protein KKB90_02165 [Actinobacteria bacterium]|nr:hypothetical protein [Actinomycetota bacterium]MCG2817865.1 hypothetical protein [Actinomycetes bacterium]MBU4217751.1 hypothetical protein [Actinomycetota bacterium]MBU4358936.1 hypothetical protein [Actinomycetota bacterium]MBU4391723.1 hypothetical protein [Actinomycetota bacterium]
MKARELAALIDKVLAIQFEGGAVGEAGRTNAWFCQYEVDGGEVDPLIPDREPDVVSNDGLEKWWDLEDGRVISRGSEEEVNAWGRIIPAGAGVPPPIECYRVLDKDRGPSSMSEIEDVLLRHPDLTDNDVGDVVFELMNRIKNRIEGNRERKRRILRLVTDKEANNE